MSAWYLYANQHRGMSLGSRGVPDPITVRFVNVALIMFVAIYCANLSRRIVDLIIKRAKR
jgi:hypothetical protein